MIGVTDATVIEYIVFAVASLMMLSGAFGVILFKNPVHAALGLILTLFGVAVHFVSQEAHFLAAVQVIVYAGAIVVLFLFVIMLLGVDKSADLSIEPIPIQRPLAAIMGLGLFGLILAAVVKAGDSITAARVGPAGRELLPDDTLNGDSNIQRLGQNLYNDHVFAFELTSVLLIVAVAGTVLLTRKWPRGLEMEDASRSGESRSGGTQ